MHIHKIFYIKSFKIAPPCFDPKIIFREPQHQVNIRKLISEYFKKCDFKKEQCSSLKMVLESKHVGAILNVLT